MAGHDVFSACPAQMLPNLWLKTWELPIMKGIDQVRSVMFTTGQFPFKCGQLVCTVCQEVVSWYLTMLGWEVLPDKMITA